MMRKGTENRRIGETNMNRESSRSHSVFTCIMESSSKGAEDGCTRVKFSRLNLVDLAGVPAAEFKTISADDIVHQDQVLARYIQWQSTVSRLICLHLYPCKFNRTLFSQPIINPRISFESEDKCTIVKLSRPNLVGLAGLVSALILMLHVQPCVCTL